MDDDAELNQGALDELNDIFEEEWQMLDICAMEVEALPNVPPIRPHHLRGKWFVTGAFHDPRQCQYCRDCFSECVGRSRYEEVEDFCTAQVMDDVMHGVRFTHINKLQDNNYYGE